jgi:serine/threonine-protein kinase
MKVVTRSNKTDHRAAERAVLEVTVLKDLNHVNVVRYHDAFIDEEGAVVLVTELLEGRLLRELLTAGGLDAERALLVGKQLADAAAAVHAIGAVHRDIKPENVFVLAGDIVKLFDFGLAKTSTVPLKTTRQLGTPRYVAPDQLTASSLAPDARWDVYALGLVVFETLAGVHPFDIDPARAPKTPAELIERHLAGNIPSLDAAVVGAPEALVDAIARAVAREPAARTPRAALFAAELDAARRTWLADRGDRGRGVSEELQQLKFRAASGVEPHAPDADELGPASLDGPTVERARPASDVTPSTGRFGTEKMPAYVDTEALRRAAEKSKP